MNRFEISKDLRDQEIGLKANRNDSVMLMSFGDGQTFAILKLLSRLIGINHL